MHIFMVYRYKVKSNMKSVSLATNMGVSQNVSG